MKLLIVSGLLACACVLSACASPDYDQPASQSAAQKRDKDADDTFTGSRLPSKR